MGQRSGILEVYVQTALTIPRGFEWSGDSNSNRAMFITALFVTTPMQNSYLESCDFSEERYRNKEKQPTKLSLLQ